MQYYCIDSSGLDVISKKAGTMSLNRVSISCYETASEPVLIMFFSLTAKMTPAIES